MKGREVAQMSLLTDVAAPLCSKYRISSVRFVAATATQVFGAIGPCTAFIVLKILIGNINTQSGDLRIEQIGGFSHARSEQKVI